MNWHGNGMLYTVQCAAAAAALSLCLNNYWQLLLFAMTLQLKNYAQIVLRRSASTFLFEMNNAIFVMTTKNTINRQQHITIAKIGGKEIVIVDESPLPPASLLLLLIPIFCACVFVSQWEHLERPQSTGNGRNFMFASFFYFSSSVLSSVVYCWFRLCRCRCEFY